jgi:hypothetical protein
MLEGNSFYPKPSVLASVSTLPYRFYYGIMHHMKAKLIYQEKFIYEDGSIREMVLWRLPEKTYDRPHGLKYRLFYGLADGTCVVRYDNETGKGDHRHIGGRECIYTFENIEKLIEDFMGDIESARKRIRS